MQAIYTPKGRALEYAPLAANPYTGCGNGCSYCYVPQILRMDRAKFDAGAVSRPGFLDALARDAAKLERAGNTEQVLLSFTTDPYHPTETFLTRYSLRTLRSHGIPFCTLTKGGTRALRDLDLFDAKRDTFASTLTSLDDSFSRHWESGAALPADRLLALQKFHEAGIFTWVSLEPVLDVEASLQIIKETHGYVDLYKIGKANYIPEAKDVDWQAYTHRVVELCQSLGAKHYIKMDLQQYLPEGY